MTDFQWIAAFIIGVGSIARITRLITWDTYPPSAWLRSKWSALTHDGPWAVMLQCGYCFGLYAGLFVVGWAALDLRTDQEIDWPWWAFNAWMAMSYWGSIMMAYDGEEG